MVVGPGRSRPAPSTPPRPAPKGFAPGADYQTAHFLQRVARQSHPRPPVVLPGFVRSQEFEPGSRPPHRATPVATLPARAFLPIYFSLVPAVPPRSRFPVHDKPRATTFVLGVARGINSNLEAGRGTENLLCFASWFAFCTIAHLHSMQIFRRWEAWVDFFSFFAGACVGAGSAFRRLNHKIVGLPICSRLVEGCQSEIGVSPRQPGRNPFVSNGTFVSACLPIFFNFFNFLFFFHNNSNHPSCRSVAFSHRPNTHPTSPCCLFCCSLPLFSANSDRLRPLARVTTFFCPQRKKKTTPLFGSAETISPVTSTRRLLWRPRHTYLRHCTCSPSTELLQVCVPGQASDDRLASSVLFVLGSSFFFGS